jgi:competence protein ComEC
VKPAQQLSNSSCHENFLQCGKKRIVIVDKKLVFDTTGARIPIDLLLISKNPKVYIPEIAKTFRIKQVVFDGSTPSWQLNYWIKDCKSLNIPFHNVNEKGAFVMNLN